MRWTQNTGPIALGVLNLGLSSETSAINRDGYIVGKSVNSLGTNRAVFWHADVWGTGSAVPYDLQSLGGPAQTLTSYAYGINSGRKIVGKSITGSTGPFHAYRTLAMDPVLPDSVKIRTADDLGTLSGI